MTPAQHRLPSSPIQAELPLSLVQDSSSYQTHKPDLSHSSHSRLRAAQRGISDEVISLVIRHGRLVRKQGLKYYFGATRHFPANVNHQLVEKCSGLVVIVGRGEIVTCYKNDKALKHIRKKREWLS
ncbi:MAG: hypothetical protein ACLFQ0_21215 [Cyclobacteriaceae bacterium]